MTRQNSKIETHRCSDYIYVAVCAECGMGVYYNDGTQQMEHYPEDNIEPVTPRTQEEKISFRKRWDDLVERARKR